MPNAGIEFLDRLSYRGLQFLPAETAHDLGKWAMRHRLLSPGPLHVKPEAAPVLFGTPLPNPLGLAAGFDKNGQVVEAALDYGFGFVEVGSVTRLGGPGNARPRMFRVNGTTLMNRMGLNGDPAEVVAARLALLQTPYYGVNIAKTHAPDILGDAAIDDMLGSYRLLHRFGLYTAINVSCPNTREGRTFEDPEPLKDLLTAIALARHGIRTPPVMVKLSPALDPLEEGGTQRLSAVLEVCEAAGVEGYVLCNTLPAEHPKFGRGGMSGAAVRERAYRMVEFVKQRLNRPIIGCGGIYDHDDLNGYLKRGCIAAQAYNGFVRGPQAGVRFAHRVLRVGVG